MKVAGGVRTAKDAIRYLVLVRETAGPAWLTPALFRIGASSLLNDLLMQRSKQLTGRYAGPGLLHARLTRFRDWLAANPGIGCPVFRVIC